MAFAQKRIDCTFQLGTGSFGEGGLTTATVSGLRVAVQIQTGGGIECHAKLWGLTPSMLNQLSSLSKAAMVLRRNLLSISAGDSVSGMGVVFQGVIVESWVDMKQPESVLTVTAMDTGALLALTPVPPTTLPGSADAATILASLAKQSGLTLENNGVSVQIATPYLSGSLGDQITAICDHANIASVIDQTTLAIWPRGGSRGGAIPLVSPDTGMVGYPCYTANGITLTTMFNPSIAFGGDIQVQSGLPQANGQWHVIGLAQELESEIPNGKWFTSLQCVQLQGTAA